MVYIFNTLPRRVQGAPRSWRAPCKVPVVGFLGREGGLGRCIGRSHEPFQVCPSCSNFRSLVQKKTQFFKSLIRTRFDAALARVAARSLDRTRGARGGKRLQPRSCRVPPEVRNSIHEVSKHRFITVFQIETGSTHQTHRDLCVDPLCGVWDGVFGMFWPCFGRTKAQW